MKAITAKYAVFNFCRVFGLTLLSPSWVRYAYEVFLDPLRSLLFSLLRPITFLVTSPALKEH